MNKAKRWRAAIEFGKDLLIVLLICSALWMLGGSGLWQRVGLGGADAPGVTASRGDTAGQARNAKPLSITATLQEETVPERCGLRQGEDGMDSLYENTAGLLMEALSSAGVPQSVGRREWHAALARAPGVCFDYRGEIPLSVLAGWLDVELSIPDATIRRLLLTTWEDSVALYYQEARSDVWYRCDAQVVSVVQLENALDGLEADGTYYAFESELTRSIAPDTVLFPKTEVGQIYSAANPAGGGRAALEQFLTELGFSLSGCVFYPAADEEVARSGSDTLRLSTAGVLEYHADQEGGQQFPLRIVAGKSRVFSAVETCRDLLERVTQQRRGEAGLYLSKVTQTDSGWRLEFEYTLNGAPVTMKRGCAAAFEVSGDHIVGFTLRLRDYVAAEGEQLLLPPVQAAAAMGALSLEGRELQLMYRDAGEETVVPDWTVVSNGAR